VARSSDGDDIVSQPSDNLSASRARAERWLECARKIAEHLRTHPGCFVESAALAGGMNPRTYRRHMEGTSDDDLAFQAIVLPALQEHAEALLESARRDIESAEGGSSAYVSWHKWLLPKRHPKLFGDQPAQVELTGKDGGPVALTHLGTAELLALHLHADKRDEPDE
jgi:hypothetical protein